MICTYTRAHTHYTHVCHTHMTHMIQYHTSHTHTSHTYTSHTHITYTLTHTSYTHTIYTYYPGRSKRFSPSQLPDAPADDATAVPESKQPPISKCVLCFTGHFPLKETCVIRKGLRPSMCSVMDRAALSVLLLLQILYFQGYE